MKKTLGLLAVLGSATAIVAYALKKEEKKHKEDDFQNMDEDDISERILKTAERYSFDEEEEEQKPAVKTASYPHLCEEDMIRLNEISEAAFMQIEENPSDERSERPLQHTVYFEDEVSLENYKNTVINEGYVVTSGEEDKELIVLNITPVNPDAILERVFHLADLAKVYHGEYIRWILK